MFKLKNITKALFCIALMATVSIASAQKIGFVSYDSLLYFHPDTKALKMKYDSIQYYYSEKLEMEKAELEAKDMQLDSLRGKMPAAQFEYRKNKIQQAMQDLEGLANLYREELSKQQEAIFKPLQEKIRKAIEEVAKANGYSSILDKQSAIYAAPTDDLTHLVMKKLNIVIPSTPPVAPGGGVTPPRGR